ncbi:MAG: hypothetical protein SF070_16480 [Gemmatimonadota bacterium]|nr:hypothetical protein [Gemmatimonadota bacterium]
MIWRSLGLLILGGLFACGDDPNQPRSGPATITIAAGAVQQGTVGQPLDTALTVLITDHQGDPVAGTPVAFWVYDDEDGIVSPSTVVTGADGLARSTWTQGLVAGGTRWAFATAMGLDTVVFQATQAAGPPAELELVAGDSQSAVVGAVLDSQIVVRVFDEFRNPVAAATVAFTAVAGGGQVSPPTAISDSLGVVRVAWTMGTTPDYDTLSAAVAGVSALVIGAEAHPAPPVDSLALGITHSCRLVVSGQTSCWGLNFAGEVGSGDTTSAFTPRVLAGAPAFTRITAGGYHSCGLTATSGLYCWGTMRTLLGLVPTLQSFPQTFASIAAGWNFMCGLTTQGLAYCWGENSSGQLGDGTTTPRAAPVRVNGGYRYRQIAAGDAHACGLTTNGRVHCWGTGPTGSIGPFPNPYSVLRFVSIAVGWEGNCGLTLGGEVWCWGRTPLARVTPAPQFTRLAAGGDAFCGVDQFGGGHCWGENSFGELGDGTQISHATPAPVAGGLVFSSISMGQVHACGATQNGELHCWGGNEAVVLGVGEVIRRRAPTAVVGGHQFTDLTAGDGFTCGTTAAGAGYCWGRNENRQLGDGGTQHVGAPVAIGGGFSFSRLSAGTGLTCGVTFSAAALCWGHNLYGELGQGTTGPSQGTPAPVLGGLNVAEVEVGRFHACARTADGRAFCWGDNSFGALGDSSTASSSVPVPVAGGHQWLGVSAGIWFTCGITSTTQTMCWGAWPGGDSSIPDTVTVGVGLSRIAASDTWGSACGIGTDQGTYCWSDSAPTPSPVPGAVPFAEIGVGNGHACALSAAGAAYCWGSNSYGSLGDGTLVSRPQAAIVVGGQAFTRLAVGAFHACGLDGSGNAWCWGDNTFGGLGFGLSATTLAPVKVQ